MAATVLTDNTVTSPDGSTVRTITYSDGTKSVQYTPGPNTPAANRATLTTAATNAIAANVTFLAIASPTTAQVTTQVKALTRQVDALIKLDLGLLDDTSGT